mgnify:CR=1 FL=1
MHEAILSSSRECFKCFVFHQSFKCWCSSRTKTSRFFPSTHSIFSKPVVPYNALCIAQPPSSQQGAFDNRDLKVHDNEEDVSARRGENDEALPRVIPIRSGFTVDWLFGSQFYAAWLELPRETERGRRGDLGSTRQDNFVTLIFQVRQARGAAFMMSWCGGGAYWRSA